jgi:hypothetical protein
MSDSYMGGDGGGLTTDLGASMGGLPDSIGPNIDWGSSGDAAGAMQPGPGDLNPGPLTMPQQFTAADLVAPSPGQLTGPQAVNMNLTTGGPPPPQSFWQRAMAGVASMAPPQGQGAAGADAEKKIYAPMPVITPQGQTTAQRLAAIGRGEIPARPAWQTIR